MESVRSGLTKTGRNAEDLLLDRWCPAMRQQFFEALERMIGDTAEHIAEPRKRINLNQFAGSNEAAEHRCRFASRVTAKERPVASSDRPAPQRTLGAVVDRFPDRRRRSNA